MLLDIDQGHIDDRDIENRHEVAKTESQKWHRRLCSCLLRWCRDHSLLFPIRGSTLPPFRGTQPFLVSRSSSGISSSEAGPGDIHESVVFPRLLVLPRFGGCAHVYILVPLKPDHDLHGCALIHRRVARGNTIEIDGEIEHSRRIEPSGQHIGEQLGQIGPNRCPPTSEGDMARKEPQKIDLFDAMGHTDEADDPSWTSDRKSPRIAQRASSLQKTLAVGSN